MLKERIRELASASGPCITVVLGSGDPGAERIGLKDALNEISARLNGDRPKEEVTALLNPLRSLPDAFQGGGSREESLVLLRSPDVFEQFELSKPMQSGVFVGEHFDPRVLLTLANSEIRFYLLALSQNRTRLLLCTDRTSEEVPLPARVPTSLDEAMETRKPDHVLDNMHTGGPSTGSMKGVMFGTSSDREKKDEYLNGFFNEIARGVETLLRGSEDPLIVVAVEHELALYKRLNTYPHLLEPGVHGAPDGLEGGEMHARALELLQSQPAVPVKTILDSFEKRVGTGHASARIPEIVKGAYEGRVSNLFLQENAHYEGTFDEARFRVKHTSDPVNHPEDLIDEAIHQTIVHGGDAMILPGSQMPNGVPVCAIFRYPAPESITTQAATSRSE